MKATIDSSQSWLSRPSVSGDALAKAPNSAEIHGRLNCESSEKIDLNTIHVSQIGRNVNRPVSR